MDTSLSSTLIPMHVHKGVHLSRGGALPSLRPLGAWGAIKACAGASPGKRQQQRDLVGHECQCSISKMTLP